MGASHPHIANGLHWLRPELEQSLTRTRAGLEQYIEAPGEKQPLFTARDELHLVRGAVDMIGCFGARMLADQMLQLVNGLIEDRIARSDDAFAALSGASLQLSDYIDMLARGSEDRAIVLQPMLNELRLASGQPVLPEADLFALQMQSLTVVGAIPAAATVAPADTAAGKEAAKRELSGFQVRFLQWFKGQNVSAAVRQVAEVAARLADESVTPALREFWSAAAALTESMPSEVADSLDVKRLFGRVGTLLKTTAESGEAAAVAQLGGITYTILFYLGRVASPSPRARTLAEQLHLASYLPSAAALEEVRGRLRGPNTAILDRVFEEIRADFAQIKDGIDLAVRTGGRSQSGMGAISERMQRLANTIGMLGLPAPRQALTNQVRAIEALDTNAGPAAWIDLATAILRVEHSLEEALFRNRSASGQPERSYAEIENEIPPGQDFRESVRALLRESFVDLALIKSAVDNYVKSGDMSALVEVAPLLREVGSGLAIIERERAAALIGQLEAYVRGGAVETFQGNRPEAERFADAVACIEVYFEALRDDLPSTDAILDQLEAFIARLELRAPDRVEAELEAQESQTALETAAAEAAPAAAASAPGQPATVESGIDPEIRDIFIEEAGEVLGDLQSRLPDYLRTPGDMAALREIRRAFHTLKGSGRMVGATGIGELCWAIENMLNKCLEGALAVRQPVLEGLQEAVALLPRLIGEFSAGAVALPQDASALVARVETVGRNVVDVDMLAVFRDDSRERLATVTRWLEAQNPQQTRFPVAGELVRAFHTLRGAAAIVDAAAVAAVAGAVEGYLNALLHAEQPVPAAALSLLADVVVTLRGWVDTFGTPDAPRTDIAPWLQRVDALQSQISSAAGARRSAVEGYTFEALDEVERVEKLFTQWAARRGARPADIGAALDALAVAAARAGDSPTARVALALSQRTATPPAVPDDAYFLLARRVVEGLYQFLDGFRSGTPHSPEATLSDIAMLPIAPPPSADEELLEIFREEAHELIGEVGQAFAAWREAPANADAADTVRRVLHTMKGSARMAGVLSIGEVSQRLEHLVKYFRQGTSFSDTMRVLEGGLEGLRGMIEALDRGVMPDAAPVLAAIDAASAQSTPTPAEVSEPIPEPGAVAIAEAAVEPSPVAEPELIAFAPPPAVEPVVIPTSLRMAEEIPFVSTPALIETPAPVDEIVVPPAEAPMEPMGFAVTPEAEIAPVQDESSANAFAELPLVEPIAEQDFVVEEIPDVAVDIELTSADEPAGFQTDDVLKAPPSPSSTPAAEPRRPAPAQPAPIEDELVAIFAAEAAELLEALEAALSAWESTEDGSAYADMQRTLHTLKGGARMAGINAMGEAAHDMETHVNAIVERDEYPDPATFRSLRSELERMQGMHDRLMRGEPVVAPAASPAAPAAPSREEIAEAPLESLAEEVETTEAAQAPAQPTRRAAAMADAQEAAAQLWNPQLFWKPDEELGGGLARREMARVPVETLDTMLNQAGEISIYRSRLEQQNAALRTQINEMSHTIVRIREQLRQMDIETDAQIAARGLTAAAGSGVDRYAQDFDPLEMDRYSRMQELSRALAESISDLASLRESMDDVVADADTLLQQQGRIGSQVQQGLMGTLMVPFSRQAPRLQRVVKQTAAENRKHAELVFEGGEAELDRNVLERMTAPLEHLLRNSVVHGIESPEVRAERGKAVSGEIRIELKREGTQLLVEVSDDGAGLNYAAIRTKAIERGLMPADARLSDADVARFIFEAGFSTASELTQTAGRGIGMDVVASEVKQLAGTLELASEPGHGTRFQIRLPLTLAVSQALLVGVGTEVYALPLPNIEGIARVPQAEVEVLLAENAPPFLYGEQAYSMLYLGDLIDQPRPSIADVRNFTVILMRVSEGLGTGERRVAVVIDQLIGNREVVSKAVGPQLSSIPGVAGATILPDGRVVFILDVPALVSERARRALLAEAAASAVAPAPPPEAAADTRDMVMVVDDSVTMRRVAERLLERNGYRVVTAKDGLDAMAQLQTEQPAVILLDIEMPRADGFEVAAFVRNTPRLRDVPIIMITSRSGEKHRERARSLGVNRYLIKPYQEDQLLAEVRAMLAGDR
jgi:chemosensory pili system protein ChpA (sensor histidine kinase/response regulator)